MNSNFLRIPEPSGPETQLLKAAATLPQLSPELRQRVLADCSRQLVVGKAIRTGQQTAMLLSSVVGIAVFVWLLLPGTAPPAAQGRRAAFPAAEIDYRLPLEGSSPATAVGLPVPAPSLGNLAATNSVPAGTPAQPAAPQQNAPQQNAPPQPAPAPQPLTAPASPSAPIPANP
jgi:hypothetical protein